MRRRGLRLRRERRGGTGDRRGARPAREPALRAQWPHALLSRARSLQDPDRLRRPRARARADDRHLRAAHALRGHRRRERAALHGLAPTPSNRICRATWPAQRMRSSASAKTLRRHASAASTSPRSATPRRPLTRSSAPVASSRPPRCSRTGRGCSSAAALYEKAGNHEKAAEAYRATGDVARAAHHFEIAYRYEDAVECYREAGNTEKVCELLEKLARYFEARAARWTTATPTAPFAICR